MPGIRPAGSGNVPTSADVAVEKEVPTSQEPGQTQQQPEDTSPNATPPKNANTMRGDLGFFGQMQGMILKDALAGNASPLSNVNTAQAAPDPNATNALRLKMLPTELEKANIPKDLRDNLLSQLSSKSGDDLRKTLDQADQALKSKDATGDVKALVTQGKVDAYFQSFNAEYELPPKGDKVRATPHFRMTTGASGPANRIAFPQVRADLQKLIQTHDKGLPKDQQLWSPQMHESVKMVAAGKGTSEQVKMVTDALIKSGEFQTAKAAHPGLSDSETIRMMQWDHGVGIDCAGYVSQAFVGVHGGNNKQYGLQETNNENLMDLKGNKHFVQVKPTDIKPGDLIALDPPSKGDVGHTLLVRNHHVATNEERNHFVHTRDLDAFSKRGDKIHIYEVDASWGAGQKGTLDGGLQRRVFIFNETTGKWGEADKPDKDGDFEVRPSTRNGPYDHPMNGIYHPTGK